MSLLRTATLALERSAYTKIPSARLIHQYKKRQFESFSCLWSTPVSSTVDFVTTAPVKPAPVFYTPHQLLHNSLVASTCSCQSLTFGVCTASAQTLKKAVHNIFIRYMSTDVPDERRVNCEELLDLIKKKEVLLIDVRGRDEVKTTGTIPESINIPVREYNMAMKAPDELFKKKYGFDKPKPDDPIVFFCASGVRSFIALRSALQMGYKNFSTSTSCYEAEKKNVAPTKIGPDKLLSYDQLVNLMERKELYLIDVREPHELQETGEIPGSINIPLTEVSIALKELSDTEFQKKYGAKKPGLTAPLVFSCRSGARSLKALQAALDLGYLRAKHYKGGFQDWEEHKKRTK